MQTAQNSISRWTIPNTEAEKTYYSTHAPKLRIYGTVATITQILWLAVSFIAAKSIFEWAFERAPNIQFLAAPLAVVTLVTLHVLLRTTYEVFWFDRLDGRTETDSSPLIPLLILAAMIAFDYQGARVFLESNVKPPTITTTAETDARHRQDVAAAKADYSQAKAEAVGIAKTKADAIRAQYGAQIAAMQGRTAASEADRRFIRGEVAKLKTKQAEALAQVEQEKAATLAGLLNAQNDRIGKAEAERERANGKTRTANEAEEQRHAADMQAVGGIAWAVSIFFALVFCLTVYASVRIRIKSGILPVRDFTGLNAHGSPWHKIGIAIQDAATRQLHRLAVWLHRVLSSGARELRDFDGRVILKEPAAFLPLHTGTKDSAGAVATAKARPIGFYKERESEADGEGGNDMSYNNATRYAPGEVVEVDPSVKPCAHCGDMFRPRTTWQKFCKEDCKLAYHEARHGERFDPGKVRRQRKQHST